MKKILTIMTVALIVAAAGFGAESLGYEEYMELIVAKLPELAQYENRVAKAENELLKARSKYDLNLSSSFSGFGNQPYTDSSPSTKMNYSAGFTGDLYLNSTLPSGTRIKIGGEYKQIYSSGENSGMGFTTDFSNVSYDPVLKLSVSQPLLNNWFGFLDRYAARDAKTKIRVEQLKQDLNKEQKLNYYSKLYFKWLEYEALLELLERTIENSETLVRQTKSRQSQGLAENDDFQRVNYALIKYREQQKSIGLDYEKLKEELGIFFEVESYSPEREGFARHYDEAAARSYEYVDFSRTGNSEILSLNKEGLEELKRVRKNQALPQLNLFGNLDIKFHIYESAVNGGDRSYSTSLGDVDFTAGLQFSYPISGLKSKSELKEVDNLINDLALQYEITENGYNKSIKSTLSYIEGLKEILTYKEQALASLKSRYKTEQTKYRQGRLELQHLLNTENQITDEEVSITKIRSTLIGLGFDYELLVR